MSLCNKIFCMLPDSIHSFFVYVINIFLLLLKIFLLVPLIKPPDISNLIILFFINLIISRFPLLQLFFLTIYDVSSKTKKRHFILYSISREFDTLKSKKVPQSLEIGLFFCQIFILLYSNI